MLKALLYPVYKRIYTIIALVWILSFLKIIMSVLFGFSLQYLIIASTVLLIFLIGFTLWFPDYYQGYLFREHSKIKANPLLNYFRQGNYAPIQTELFEENLEIIGNLPKALNGEYMRNGPNPAFLPISYTYPIDGDGMLHAVKIQNGKASYQNRYIKTQGLVAEKRAGEALYGGIENIIPVDPKLIGKNGDLGPIKNTASIHIIHHAKRYLALYEASPPYEVSNNLETIGLWKPDEYDSAKPFHMNAHTKLDPDTGELYAFTYDATKPYLTYYVFDKKGKLKTEQSIQKKHTSMMHDFVLTANYLVFFDCPALFEAETFWQEGRLINWHPDLNTTVILIHRRTKAEIKIEMDPFFVYHFANGYEENGELIVDYVRHETFTLGDALHTDFSGLYRLVIDLKTHHFAHHLLFNERIEFPRVNEAYLSKPYRYIYSPLKTAGHIKAFHALLQFDLKTKKAYTHDFGVHQEVDEAVFIPDPSSKPGDEKGGWLGLFVYNSETDTSEFVLLSAKHFRKDPIARIKLPQRIPHGLHGSWIAK